MADEKNVVIEPNSNVLTDANNNTANPADSVPQAKTPKAKTKVDELIERIKNNSILSIVVILGVIVIALGSFTDSINKIIGGFSAVLPSHYSVTIKVFDKEDLPIQSGFASLGLENESFTESITKGEATFKEIPTKFKDKIVKVDVNIDGYKLISPNQVPLSSANLHVHVDKAVPTITSTQNTANLQSLPIAVLLSGDLAYTRKILRGLETTLENSLPPLGYKPEIYSLAGPEEPLTQDGVRQAWAERIETILKRGGFKYYVGVGTQASTMFAEHLGDKLGETPYIFAGVTNPKRQNLVDSLKGRTEKRNIAGVAYLGEPEELAERIHFIFPKRKLVFIYQRGTPQDEDMAFVLKDTKLFKDKNLSIIRTEGIPTINDMPDVNAVYFSWYTIERMFEHSNWLDVLKNRLIIATTEANVKADELAVVGVSTDDYEIGREAANIVASHLSKKVSLGEMDVIVPELLYWINCKTASQRSVEFDPLILMKAKERFSCN